MLGLRVFALASLVASACAASGSDEMPDAGAGDPDEPDEPDPQAECMPGTNSGMHACGMTCVPDNVNTVELGCRFGCGEACPGGGNGSATRTAVGTCGLECNPGYANVNGECVVLSCSDVGYVCGD